MPLTLTQPALVLIDLDGTLIDSVPDLAYCVDAMMHELMIFLNGEHDDMVDSMMQVLIYLRDTRMLSIDNNKDEYDVAPRKERTNPYAM